MARVNSTPRLRPIPDFPGYAADALGRIWSSRHPRHRGRWRLLRSAPGTWGYRQVTLYRDGRQTCRPVHVLVLTAFKGPKPTEEHQAAHGDGVRTNNRPGNLRWATPLENAADKLAHGTNRSEEDNPRSKLTAAQARAIVTGRAAGKPITTLARTYGVSDPVVRAVIIGRTWRRATAALRAAGVTAAAQTQTTTAPHPQMPVTATRYVTSAHPGLGSRQRQLLELVERGGQTAATLAAATGLRQATVRKMLFLLERVRR